MTMSLGAPHDFTGKHGVSPENKTLDPLKSAGPSSFNEAPLEKPSSPT